jgi:hypothetical protein
MFDLLVDGLDCRFTQVRFCLNAYILISFQFTQGAESAWQRLAAKDMPLSDQLTRLSVVITRQTPRTDS